jgi:hypothetical protein
LAGADSWLSTRSKLERGRAFIGGRCNESGLTQYEPQTAAATRLSHLGQAQRWRELHRLSLREIIEQGLRQDFRGSSEDGAVRGLRLGEIGR